ncbi:hypothetical protein KSP39_PZI015872 [Platanthera zijinensis]|uniref:Retrotransposon gag domain-containing protein n=1 Tax=Platanthera zijinensis TaxID=2320716 RepID=A0AAP0B996_9ASPA
MNSIDKAIQPSVTYLESAKAVWDELGECFTIGNAPRVYELKNEIASFCQQGMTIKTYYTNLKGLWDELSSHSKIPTCTCDAAK